MTAAALHSFIAKEYSNDSSRLNVRFEGSKSGVKVAVDIRTNRHAVKVVRTERHESFAHQSLSAWSYGIEGSVMGTHHASLHSDVVLSRIWDTMMVHPLRLMPQFSE